MEKELTKHILLRYSDNLTPSEGAILLHNQIIESHGYVWMGKFGRPIAKSNLDLLKEQIKNDLPTYLFLVQKSRKKYVVGVGELAGVSKSLTSGEVGKVPNYYRQDVKIIRVWFKVKRFYSIDNSVLQKLIISNSGMPANESLRYSMAGFFIVRLERGIRLKDFNLKKV